MYLVTVKQGDIYTFYAGIFLGVVLFVYESNDALVLTKEYAEEIAEEYNGEIW